ncbi:N-acetylneuraminate synthase family protein [Thalassospira alkalitolerans]|uniref:N-acetylneuraminate synthase family protein n=1 Tax=Thalassospira alkalitolerans TaxID=1293890 RepID=UPI0030EE313D|tara:strand:- start:51764 stop:52867 length:1104 start_codon:yes stop_codon:yes gene_type:complete
MSRGQFYPSGPAAASLNGKTIEIGGRKIGSGQPAFVIAEISQNHCGELSMAKELVDAAKECGCDCAKFQTFTAEEMCADRSKMFTYLSQGKEVTESEFDLHKRFEFTQDEWAELIEYCGKVGIPFMTTIQDPPNLTQMLKLGINAIKVGSDDFDHLPNLDIYTKSGLPIIMSKGMANLAEVDKVVRFMRERTDRLAIMHCVSIYPTASSSLNLNQIKTLALLYPDIVWGFSDHSEGALASILAVANGAKVIEKHFTLDHDLPGPDHWFSANPVAMKELVDGIRFAEDAMGSGDVVPAPGEAREREIRRRRIVAKKDIKRGQILDENNVAFKRSDDGLFVSDWGLIIGSKVRKDLAANNGIELKHIEF